MNDVLRRFARHRPALVGVVLLLLVIAVVATVLLARKPRKGESA